MQGVALRRRVLVLPLAVILVAAGLVLARSRVSEGATAGTISTYVGSNGCPGAASVVADVDPRAVVFDGDGHLFIGQPTSIVRVDRFTKAVTQVPGAYNAVQELAIDGAGNLYVLEGADTGPGPITPPRWVTRVAPDGTVAQVVPPIGNNNNVPGPVAMAVALDGTIYLGGGTQVIRQAPGAGLEVLVNAGGAPGTSGDGGPAHLAQLRQVAGLAVDTSGSVYVSDKAEGRVRRVSGGTINTVAGGAPFHNGTYPIGASSDFVASETMAVNGADLFLVEADRHQVVKLSGGLLSLAAGNGGGSDGCFGDGGPATSAELNLGQGARSGADVDPASGDLYIADDGNNKVRTVAAAGSAWDNGRGNAFGWVPPPAAPEADFNAPAGPLRPGVPLQFVNTSRHATSYSWDFGDGTPADPAVHPYHVFQGAGTYQVTLTATQSAGVSDTVTKSVTVPPLEGPPPVAYVPRTPVRVADTRSGVGGFSVTPVTGGTFIEVDVAGPLGLPVSEIAGGAVALNLTGILPTNQTYLQVFPGQEDRPLSSNLNLVPNQTLPNMVIAKVGANGKVNVFNAVGYTHSAVDLVGYFPPGSDFTATSPSRVLDTRPGINVGAGAGRVGQGQSVVLDLNGQVPANAGAVVLNVTAINASAESYVSVFPAGEPQPFVSNLNFAPGETIANLVVVKLDSANQLRLFNAVGDVDLAADLMGWIPEGSPLFTGVAPARVFDSRTSGGPLGPGQTITLNLGGKGGVPTSGVKGVVLNVTAADISGESFVAVYPGGEAYPGSSNLYLTPGDVVPNLVVSKVGADGGVNILNAANSANIIVDVMGFMT